MNKVLLIGLLSLTIPVHAHDRDRGNGFIPFIAGIVTGGVIASQVRPYYPPVIYQQPYYPPIRYQQQYQGYYPTVQQQFAPPVIIYQQPPVIYYYPE